MSTKRRWRPSELEKLELCTAYRGSALDTAVSAEGTMLHKAMEDIMASPDKLPAVLETLGQEHAGLIRYAHSAMMTLVSECSCSARIECEVPLDLFKQGRIRIRGKADVVVVEPELVTVVDYKFGRLPVTPADGNLQGWGYAYGAFRKYGTPKVRVVFVAPHFQEVSSHVFEATDVPAIGTRIAAVVARCQQDETPTPSPTACQYCSRKMTCPAIGERALAVSTHFAGIAIPKEYFPGPDTTVEQRNIAQHLAGILEDWGNLWKKSNREAALENGVELPDFALRSRAGARAILDIGAAWRIVSECGVPPEVFLSACKVSVPDLESAIKQLEKGGMDGVTSLVMEKLENAGVLVTNPDSVYLQRKPKAELGAYIKSLTSNKEIEGI